jgi:hypothetical protein
LDSELSEPCPWTVAYTGPNVAGLSEYCDFEIDPVFDNGNGVAGNEDAAYWTWETNEAGQIVISIEGAVTPETTAFRGIGMNLGNFSIAGIAGSVCFNKIGNNEGKTQTLQLKPGFVIPVGMKITYNGIVEYRTLPLGSVGELDNLYSTLQFEYTYGSNCTTTITQLTTPTTLSITEDSILNFTGDPNADSFTVFVYDGATEVHVQTGFTSGDVINFTTPGAYTVKVQAIGDGTTYLSSLPSTAIPWTVTGTGLAAPATSVVSVYPLPAQDVLYIKGVNAPVTVKIVNVAGKTVVTQRSKGEVNVTGLASGIYLLYIDNTVVKFIKK